MLLLQLLLRHIVLDSGSFSFISDSSLFIIMLGILLLKSCFDCILDGFIVLFLSSFDGFFPLFAQLLSGVFEFLISLGLPLFGSLLSLFSKVFLSQSGFLISFGLELELAESLLFGSLLLGHIGRDIEVRDITSI